VFADFRLLPLPLAIFDAFTWRCSAELQTRSVRVPLR